MKGSTWAETLCQVFIRCHSFSAHLRDDTCLPGLHGSYKQASVLEFQEHFLMENPSLL